MVFLPSSLISSTGSLIIMPLEETSINSFSGDTSISEITFPFLSMFRILMTPPLPL